MKIDAGTGELQYTAIENNILKQLESVIQDSELLFFVLQSTEDNDFILTYLSPNFKRNIVSQIGFFQDEDLVYYRNSFFCTPCLLENVATAFEEGRRATFEMRWEVKNTTGFWRINLSPSFGDGGMCTGFSGNVLNVTEEVGAKTAFIESENRYRLLSSLAFETIMIHNNGKIIDINNAAIKLTGFSKEELMRMNPVEDIITPNSREVVKERMLRDYAHPYEIEIIHKSGKIIPIEVESRFVYHHGEKVRVAAMRDISERKNAERALADSEARWQFALEGSEQGVYDINLIDYTVFFSRKYKEMLGYEEKEVKNQISEWERLMHPDELEPIRESVASFLKGGEGLTYQQEYRMRCKNGDYKWVLARGKVIEWTDEGEPRRMIGTHMDIDYLKRTELALKESMRKFHNTLHSMASGVMEVDLHGTVVFVNPKACEMLGVEEEMVLQKNYDIGLWQRVSRDGKQINKEDTPIFMALQGEEVKGSEFGLIVNNGYICWVSVNASPLFDEDGKQYGAVSSFQDITESKLNDDALRSAHEELQQYNVELRSINEKMQELGEFKNGLTRMIVHDLKNPLSQIINLAQIPNVEHSARQMYNMVLNILEVQQFEEAEVKLAKSTFAITEAFEQALEQLEWLLGRKEIQVKLELDISLQVEADHDFIMRVLVNLISNAAKFTLMKGVIVMKAFKVEKEVLKVAVEDNGPGIPKEFQHKVFDKFVKLNTDAPRTLRSTGLGLTFCKMAIEAHDGKIGVTDSELGGAAFWFEIPIHANV
ncbi:PAS domain S-box protein [Flammeovirgaceae bacterium SG7u.111]|nr:PAS domain S-box protein [Flammeovirgaceae bacterium SG7u.132]WPO37699.1 PAS domain S-box protein [Flammeovirgaceae bacterium SG7u.111]